MPLWADSHVGHKDGMALWQLVSEARKRAGLTQWALSQRAGVAQSTVACIESGARCPSTDMVEHLVRAAGFEIHAALGERDPQTTSILERNLRRRPAERLEDAVRVARFVQNGRTMLRTSDDG